MNAKEDTNFRLFAYVGDVNSEAENLQEQAQQVQREVDRYQAAADAQEAERQAKLQVKALHSPELNKQHALGLEAEECLNRCCSPEVQCMSERCTSACSPSAFSRAAMEVHSKHSRKASIVEPLMLFYHAALM